MIIQLYCLSYFQMVDRLKLQVSNILDPVSEIIWVALFILSNWTVQLETSITRNTCGLRNETNNAVKDINEAHI